MVAKKWDAKKWDAKKWDAKKSAAALALTAAQENAALAVRDSGDAVLVAVDTQNLEQVLLGVEVVGVALDELANDRDGVELEQFDDERAGQHGVVIVHQRDDGGVLEGKDGVGCGFILEDLFGGGYLVGEPAHVHRDADVCSGLQ